MTPLFILVAGIALLALAIYHHEPKEPNARPALAHVPAPPPAPRDEPFLAPEERPGPGLGRRLAWGAATTLFKAVVTLGVLGAVIAFVSDHPVAAGVILAICVAPAVLAFLLDMALTMLSLAWLCLPIILLLILFRL